MFGQVFQFEKDPSDHAVLVGRGQEGRNDAEARRGIGKDRRDASVAPSLSIDGGKAWARIDFSLSMSSLANKAA